ncbi:MAG: hypothetical protein GXY56_08380 [Clostridiales bacterium]|nr:hypothetical protein [Clostridiales bacterium]
MKNKVLAGLVCAALLLAAFPLTAAAQSDFKDSYTDVAGKWYAAAVSEYGYSEVFSDGRGSFHADRDVTRMEFVRLLHRALNIQINYFAAPDVADSFEDMQNSDVWANELIDLVTAGIIESGGNFRPNEPLLREEMIHWTINALNHKTGGNYPVILMMPAPFDDDADIDEAYHGNIVTAVLLKLINGRGDNRLFPKDGATRAEAVTVVYRLMTLQAGYGAEVGVHASALRSQDGSIRMSLSIRNQTDESILISHNSGQQYDFKLFDAKGNNVYTWSADKMFIAALTETGIGAGEEIVFSDTIDGGINELISTAVSMKAYIVGASEDFMIEVEGYEAQVR